ncbi:MAG: response regulator [Spirochaetia bacterium]|nr:response regulator [Spirochaetia bacterium]
MDIATLNRRIPDGVKVDGKSYRILVVDDSRFVIKQLSQILSSEEYEVCGTAENGQLALDAYQELRPDLVTLDITMPILDGLQTLEKVLAYDPKAKVVMVSALGKEETVKQALLAGAKSFIVKPFDRATVLERLKKAIGV